MLSELDSSRSTSSGPFTTFRVCRFLLLWLVGIAAICGGFYTLFQMRAGQSITAPQSSGTQRR